MLGGWVSQSQRRDALLESAQVRTVAPADKRDGPGRAEGLVCAAGAVSMMVVVVVVVVVVLLLVLLVAVVAEQWQYSSINSSSEIRWDRNRKMKVTETKQDKIR
jgi:uncharacterized membrane protein